MLVVMWPNIGLVRVWGPFESMDKVRGWMIDKGIRQTQDVAVLDLLPPDTDILPSHEAVA